MLYCKKENPSFKKNLSIRNVKSTIREKHHILLKIEEQKLCFWEGKCSTALPGSTTLRIYEYNISIEYRYTYFPLSGRTSLV